MICSKNIYNLDICRGLRWNLQWQGHIYPSSLKHFWLHCFYYNPGGSLLGSCQQLPHTWSGSAFPAVLLLCQLLGAAVYQDTAGELINTQKKHVWLPSQMARPETPDRFWKGLLYWWDNINPASTCVGEAFSPRPSVAGREPTHVFRVVCSPGLTPSGNFSLLLESLRGQPLLAFFPPK